MLFEAKLNSITRLVILLTILGFLLTKKMKIVLSGLITLGAIILLYKLKTRKTVKEGFTNSQLYSILKDDFTEPVVTNPAMNILLPEINDNPLKKEAAPAFNPIVEAKMNATTKQFIINNFKDPAIEERLFNDLGDNFTFDQSMRAWNPMPSSTIPNDQKAFTEYCYGDMIACRDIGNNELACVRNAPPRYTNY
jgi:hypothetical protein